MGQWNSKQQWRDCDSFVRFVSATDLPSTPNQSQAQGNDNPSMAVMADDPRSPIYVDSSFNRTPLQLDAVNGAKRLMDMSDNSLFLSTDCGRSYSASPMPQLLGPPLQSVLDPRSPSLGVDRTPLPAHCGQPAASESLEVHTNFSNLAASWQYDEGLTGSWQSEEVGHDLADDSELFVTELDQKTEQAVSTPLKMEIDIGEDAMVKIEIDAVTESGTKIPQQPIRTPLAKVNQGQSPIVTPNLMHDSSSPMIFKLAANGNGGVAKRSSKNTPGYQKKALTNRLRIDNVGSPHLFVGDHHEKEN